MEFLNQLKSSLNQPVLSELETSEMALVCTESEVLYLNAAGLQRASLVDIAKVNREGEELVISSVKGELIRGALNVEKEALANFFTVVQSAGQRAHTKAAAARVESIPEKPAPIPVPLEVALPKTVQVDSFHQDVRQAAPITKMSPVTNEVPRGATENAGFWMRFLAAIIDGILVSIITSIISSIFGLNNAMIRLNEISRSVAEGGSIQAIQNEAGSLVAPILLSLIFSLLVNWLYFALLESSKQQATLGKMALGLKVTNMLEQPIGFGQATWRYFAKQIPGLVAIVLFSFGIVPFIPAISDPTSAAARAAAGTFLLLLFISMLVTVLPFLMAGFTAKKQALHDLMAKTLVVKPK
jgi:uncharacterized RDD family membrane protein YckC